MIWRTTADLIFWSAMVHNWLEPVYGKVLYHLKRPLKASSLVRRDGNEFILRLGARRDLDDLTVRRRLPPAADEHAEAVSVAVVEAEPAVPPRTREAWR